MTACSTIVEDSLDVRSHTYNDLRRLVNTFIRFSGYTLVREKLSMAFGKSCGPTCYQSQIPTVSLSRFPSFGLIVSAGPRVHTCRFKSMLLHPGPAPTPVTGLWSQLDSFDL